MISCKIENHKFDSNSTFPVTVNQEVAGADRDSWIYCGASIPLKNNALQVEGYRPLVGVSLRRYVRHLASVQRDDVSFDLFRERSCFSFY
jgi:hypothetical protein